MFSKSHSKKTASVPSATIRDNQGKRANPKTSDAAKSDVVAGSSLSTKKRLGQLSLQLTIPNAKVQDSSKPANPTARQSALSSLSFKKTSATDQARSSEVQAATNTQDLPVQTPLIADPSSNDPVASPVSHDPNDTQYSPAWVPISRELIAKRVNIMDQCALADHITRTCANGSLPSSC